MDGMRTLRRCRCVTPAIVVLLVAGAAVGACGTADTASGEGDATATQAVAPTPATPLTPSADQFNLPSAEVVAALEGRIAAMNRGDGVAAAAFYAPDGVLEETDMTPHLVTRGRDELATRFADLYSMGLRLEPAGAPIANDKYVVEPTRFYNLDTPPGRGAGMLVFEVNDQDQLAYQWMVGWAAGPEETFAILASPSPDQANLPPRRVMKILEGRMAAMNRGDGEAAAAFYAKDGVLEEMDATPRVVSKGRVAIAARLDTLYEAGLRLAPAGAPIAYDCYAAQPVAFTTDDGSGSGAGVLVFAFDPAYTIAHEYVIGWVSD